MPSTGRRDLLEPCLDGLLHRTTYEPLEVVVTVDEGAYEDAARRDFLSELASLPGVRVTSYPSRPFNYALTVNEAVAETTSPFVLLLNDDTEVVYDDWLEAMVGYAQDERVGAVGGQLVYPDGTIHSAGMLLGARAIAENRYHRRPELTMGYGNRAQLPQDLSAVVGTSMLVRRTAFDEVGGPRYLVPGGLQRRRLLSQAPAGGLAHPLRAGRRPAAPGLGIVRDAPARA